MKRTAFAVLLAMFATITAANADTLRLRSGTIIDGTAHPIMTSGFQSKGGSEGKETL